MSRIIKRTTVLIALSAGILYSPIATYLAADYILPLAGIQVKNMSGSLWSGQFKADQITASGYQINSLQVSGVKVFKRSIASVSIDKLAIQASAFDGLGGRSSFSISQLNVESIKVQLDESLYDISFKNLYMDDKGLLDITLSTAQMNYQLHSSSMNDHVHEIDITSPHGIMKFNALKEGSKWQISDPSNSFDQFLIEYDTKDAATTVNIQKTSKSFSIDLTGSGQLGQRNWRASLRKLQIQNQTFNTTATAHLDMLEKQYALNINDPSLTLEVSTSKYEDIIASGQIKHIETLTPLAQGQLRFIGIYDQYGKANLSVHAEKISSPFVTLEGVDATYIEDGPSPFGMSIASMYNQVFEAEHVSLTSVAQDNNDMVLNVVGLVNGYPQSATIHTTLLYDKLQLVFQNLSIRSNIGTWKNQSAGSLHLSPNDVVLSNFCLNSDQSKLCLDGTYQLKSDQWQLNYLANQLPLALSSQGLLNSDTEVVINNSDVNANLQISGHKKDIDEIYGDLSLQSVNISAYNLAPDFIFPLDYNAKDGYINITFEGQTQNIRGKLISPQGNISLSTDDNQTLVSSKKLDFSFATNKLSIKPDIILSGDSISGNIDIFKLLYYPDRINSYQALLSNLNIITSTAAPNLQSSQTALTLNAQDAEVSFMGFNGTTDAKLQLNVDSGGSEQVSGFINMKSPSLDILNRRIALETLSIKYKDQPWLDGNIQTSLTADATFDQGTSNAYQGEVFIRVNGNIESPNVEVGSRPHNQSALNIFTEILNQSQSLPTGNENNTLLAYISGLDKQGSTLGILNAINNLSTSFNIDLSLGKQVGPEATDETELVVKKQLSKQLWLIIRHPLNEQSTDNIALSLRLMPRLRVEGQYSKDSLGLSILLSN